jgi:hypothetical protein
MANLEESDATAWMFVVDVPDVKLLVCERLIVLQPAGAT